jgi:hypothetical protein
MRVKVLAAPPAPRQSDKDVGHSDFGFGSWVTFRLILLALAYVGLFLVFRTSLPTALYDSLAPFAFHLVLALPVAALVGTILALVGMSQNSRRPWLAVIGCCLNAAALIGSLVFWAIALAEIS